ncbi:hypothetical protein ELUMI_v1c05070 [Williamsoniiplasma luminosum]|uniref:Antitoxin SocA-like Panacea domain-containing protein n=1 Tax=Williamsoniiplasma luminosum TaxID=214888 RepID=A0A2K8NWW3_9MOLU|nr:type II toxin-antitoxin system antitoxin SocA domain-containing protein [Williamsoniiplasma luminosum]ATZ17231.1 hypothetical protein ELUMI_v1c05070 [Williamsoniiplasma luminosum]
MNVEYIKEVISKRKKINSFFELDTEDIEKIWFASNRFFDISKQRKFTIYKTHFLKFISILEIEYMKQAGNYFTSQKMIRMENGPVPSKMKDFIDYFFLEQLSSNNEISPFKISNKTNGKKQLEWNEEFETFKIFSSEFELNLIEWCTNKIFELNNSKKLSDFTHKYKSWINAVDGKEMNLLDEIDDKERRFDMEIIYG